MLSIKGHRAIPRLLLLKTLRRRIADAVGAQSFVHIPASLVLMAVITAGVQLARWMAITITPRLRRENIAVSVTTANHITRCRTNPREVEVVQWDGVNVGQLEAWGCVIARKPESDGSLWIGELGDEEVVLPGWWIVKDPDAVEFWIEIPEKFAAWFVPITQESNADTSLTLAEIREPKRRQLVHTARQMFETRWAKYNDPHNEEWDFDDVTDKWERHAWSAYLDLVAVEKERDTLLSIIDSLQLSGAALVQEEFCYAEGDEGSKYCGGPKGMHCAVLGDAVTTDHLVECMRSYHFIHHPFIPAPPSLPKSESSESTDASKEYVRGLEELKLHCEQRRKEFLKRERKTLPSEHATYWDGKETATAEIIEHIRALISQRTQDQKSDQS